MDGFEFLRDAWKKFADKVDGQDLANRALRSAGAGGKSLVDRGLQEFPKDYIEGVVDSAYGLVTNPDIAEGISRNVRAFDEEKIKDMLDGLLAQLKEDGRARGAAKLCQFILAQSDNDQIQATIERLIPEDRMNERVIFSMLFMQAGPVLDEMRAMDAEDLAEKIKELADTIPTDILALQAAGMTREITPERISAQVQSAMGQLPSGKAIAEIVHGVGGAASKHFDSVAKARSLKDATDALSALRQDAAAIVAGKVADDKKKPVTKPANKKRGGGDFTL